MRFGGVGSAECRIFRVMRRERWDYHLQSGGRGGFFAYLISSKRTYEEGIKAIGSRAKEFAWSRQTIKTQTRTELGPSFA